MESMGDDRNPFLVGCSTPYPSCLTGVGMKNIGLPATDPPAENSHGCHIAQGAKAPTESVYTGKTFDRFPCKNLFGCDLGDPGCCQIDRVLPSRTSTDNKKAVEALISMCVPKSHRLPGRPAEVRAGEYAHDFHAALSSR